jgi:Catalase
VWLLLLFGSHVALAANAPPTACDCCVLQAWRILDFLVNYPESAHMLTWLLDEPGIPTDYRHMEGERTDQPGLATACWSSHEDCIDLQYLPVKHDRACMRLAAR